MLSSFLAYKHLSTVHTTAIKHGHPRVKYKVLTYTWVTSVWNQCHFNIVH